MARQFASIEDALASLRSGRPVLVLDNKERENEGDVILAAETASAQWVGWMVRHSSGLICAPMTDEIADHLALPLMVTDNQDPKETAYTITADAKLGTTTGISAADRARTLTVLGHPDATAEDLIRPGHVFPLRSVSGGVLVRGGHTEAAVDLCRLAGLTPVGAIAELVHDDGSMMRTAAVLELGQEFGLPVITIEQLAEWRNRHDRVERVTKSVLPTDHGTFAIVGYRDKVTGDEYVALTNLFDGMKVPALVRLHSECLTGDVFGSRRCDCGAQLHRALARVAEEGGAVIYLRGHEGRGVGLLNKLRAYTEQDHGFDTVDAQTNLGLPVDARSYAAGAAILHDLGLTSVRLLTNNPRKVDSLRGHGIGVTTIEPIVIAPVAENVGYLTTKRDRLGHHLNLTQGVD